MNSRPIMSVLVRSGGDVVLVRQRAQAIAELAGFAGMKQTSLATALSEIARNALHFAGEARVAFATESDGHTHYLTAVVTDQGPGIARILKAGGDWNPGIGFQGQGIASARKLVKLFSIHCPPAGGTVVKLGLPFAENYPLRPESVAAWGAMLAGQKPRNLLEEMHYRNQELVVMLEELQRKETALESQVAADAVLKAALAESKQGLEERVQERTASLTLSNEDLRAFSYTVSHDLRAPLRAINGFTCELLEEHLQPNDAGGEALGRRVLQATERMDSLIGDLVAYTEASKVLIGLREVDSRSLIEELLKTCRARLTPDQGSMEMKGDFPMITANPAILQKALLNLVENAFKFRLPFQTAFVRFRGAAGQNKLRLWVEDHGIGIAPEHHEQIFKVFERLHGAEIPGTGIGLALVKRWVASMRGAVGVESAYGSGARFWIDLPLSSSAFSDGPA